MRNLRHTREDIERRIADPSAFEAACRDLREFLLCEPTLSNYQFANRILDAAEHGRPEMNPGRRVRLALLTSYTADFAVPLLKVELMLSGFSAGIYKPHYNQFRQELLDGGSGLYAFKPDVVIAGFNLEDVFSDAAAHFPSLPEAERRRLEEEILDLYESLANAFRRHAGTHPRLLLQDLCAPFDAYDGLVRSGDSIQAFVDRVNAQLRARLGGCAGVHVLEYSRLVQECGARTWTDPRIYYSARIPVAQHNWIPLAQRYAAYVRAALGLEIKCIVLDLDNTLWGGVLGEDGPSGIRVDDAYPGIVFRRFQQFLLGLSAGGYILAVSSKNNHDDVIEVLRTHPGMVLREHHFAAIRANWNPKEQNIREISNEIRISPDHMLFVDDNPVEIANVRAALPGVACLHLESPPVDFVRQFEAIRCIGKLLVTGEDRTRAAQYVQERKRREVMQSAPTLEDFYRKLRQRLTVYINHRPHIQRIAQLSERTNQFNMTTLRLSPADVERMLALPDYLLLTADLADEFGDSGTIAYIQIRTGPRAWTIENWLMSCRVLGRSVEQTLLHYVASLAHAAGAESLLAIYAPTKKNQPFADFYPKNGFEISETAGNGESRFALRPGSLGAYRGHVEIIEGNGAVRNSSAEGLG